MVLSQHARAWWRAGGRLPPMVRAFEPASSTRRAGDAHTSRASGAAAVGDFLILRACARAGFAIAVDDAAISAGSTRWRQEVFDVPEGRNRAYSKLSRRRSADERAALTATAQYPLRHNCTLDRHKPIDFAV